MSKSFRVVGNIAAHRADIGEIKDRLALLVELARIHRRCHQHVHRQFKIDFEFLRLGFSVERSLFVVRFDQ